MKYKIRRLRILLIAFIGIFIGLLVTSIIINNSINNEVDKQIRSLYDIRGNSMFTDIVFMTDKQKELYAEELANTYVKESWTNQNWLFRTVFKEKFEREVF